MSNQQGNAVDQLESGALLTKLLNLSKQMAEIRTLKPLLDFIVGELLSLVNAERGFIIVLQKDQQLEVKLSRERGESKFHNDIDQVSRSIINFVSKLEQPLLVKNASLDPRFNTASSVFKLRLRSVMCVPLITKNSLLGVFYVENRAESGVFSTRELEILEFFSHHAAVSIRNAELNDNLEEIVKERTQQYFEAKESAEKANSAKTEFLSYISHELRSPLTSTLNYSEMLQRRFYGEITVKQDSALRNISNGVQHILELVNDLLDLNQIESGSMYLQLTDFDLVALLNETYPIVESLLMGKPISMEYSFEKSRMMINGDRKRIKQIFLNLLTNAAKFTNEGYIRLHVTQDGQLIKATITDTGIGIPQEDQAWIYESYRQSHNNPKHAIGTGLGLPITKKLVELHHGEIEFESQVGTGTQFTVQFPIYNS